MARRLIFPVLLGLLGCGILVSLGLWQVQRLGWKQQILTEIDAAIHAAPVPLPPEGQGERFTPVEAAGDLGADYVRVLVSRKQIGPGFRIVAPLEMVGGRRVLVDLGFVRDGDPVPALAGPVSVIGNIDRPEEVDAYTPAPDLGRNIWFARDVPALAAHLGTESTFIAAREDVLRGIEAMALTPEGIPNNHLQYAFTWFLLAAVWAGMTGLLIWRIWQRKP